MDLLGELGEDCDAHHIFVQKFANAFFDAGIDIHNPLFGALIEMHQHRKDVSAYQKEWEKFFEGIKYLTNKKARRKKIFKFARELAKRYDFKILF